ncbi:MAG: DUF4262 domain-containing protein [Microbacterium sp.]
MIHSVVCIFYTRGYRERTTYDTQVRARNPGGDQCSCCAQFGDAPEDARRDEQPPFAYAVGLFGIGHPALLIVGVDPQTASAVLPNLGEIAFAANRFYARTAEHSVPLLQLTYDDTQRRFPGEEGYANPAWIQSRPGQFRA